MGYRETGNGPEQEAPEGKNMTTIPDGKEGWRNRRPGGETWEGEWTGAKWGDRTDT